MVSTQDIGRYAPVIPALKVLIPADIGHAGQGFGRRAPQWSEQSRRQDPAVLGLGAVAMGPGSLFEGLHHRLIDAAYEQISHVHPITFMNTRECCNHRARADSSHAGCPA